MVTPRICVVHNSDRIRETLAILLEGRGQIEAYSVTAVVRDRSIGAGADLVVAQGDAPSAAIACIPNPGRILWILGPTQTSAPTVGALNVSAPSSFTPSEIICKVDELLATPLPDDAEERSTPVPLIPEAAAEIIRCAQKLDLPVLICGEPGCGKSRIARAIHSAHPQRSFQVLASGIALRTLLDQVAQERPLATTLCIRDLLSLTAADAAGLCDLLDDGGFASPDGWHPVRIITCAPIPYEELGGHSHVPRELFYRLGALTISLAPLRHRAGEIPSLAQSIADRLTTALARPPVRFSAAAMQRLQRYLWFGNLLELETVLARSIARMDAATLDIADLLFGYGPPKPAPIAETPAQPRSSESEASRAADLIINELAHEFKNPLVAIKTVTQQLDHFTRDEAGRQHVAKLAGDAVERMDQTIENLVQYSHFGAPNRTNVALGSLLTNALVAVKDVAGERHIDFDYSDSALHLVYVDPGQIEYALENLLRAVVRDVDEGRTISVRSAGATGTIEIEFQKGGLKLSERLSTMLGQPANGHSTAEPLGFVFAKTLVERNAGQIDVSSSGAARVVTVHLPVERNDSSR